MKTTEKEVTPWLKSKTIHANWMVPTALLSGLYDWLTVDMGVSETWIILGYAVLNVILRLTTTTPLALSQPESRTKNRTTLLALILSASSLAACAGSANEHSELVRRLTSLNQAKDNLVVLKRIEKKLEAPKAPPAPEVEEIDPDAVSVLSTVSAIERQLGEIRTELRDLRAEAGIEEELRTTREELIQARADLEEKTRELDSIAEGM